VPVCLLQIRKFFTIGQKGWTNSFKVFGLFSALLWQNQLKFSADIYVWLVHYRKLKVEHFKPIFIRKEMMYLRICGFLDPQKI
jgi:hypothetical protein